MLHSTVQVQHRRDFQRLKEMLDGGSFAKTICSICYEDLNPIIEDIQSIFKCGHVFHELCLHQWFEYCSSTKKCTCPVCKQYCKSTDVSRLYFQSIGDVTETAVPRKPIDSVVDAEVLRREVKKLEVKVSGLSSTLDSREKQCKELNEELCDCKERVKLEAKLKNEALQQKASLQQLYRMKSEDLENSTAECLRLQEKNMALAKEVAAFKLVSNFDLDEDEVLKLAALENETSNKDTIDVLRKSLVLRNRNYKELMAKCKLLGKAEARCSKKLEKAKVKITKLKVRIQELETAVEVKENEALRSLKTSKKCSSTSFVENNILREDQGNNLSTPEVSFSLSRAENFDNHLFPSKLVEESNLIYGKHVRCSEKPKNVFPPIQVRDYGDFTVDDAERDISAFSNFVESDLTHGDKANVAMQKSEISISKVAPVVNRETVTVCLDDLDEPLHKRTGLESEMEHTGAGSLDDDLIILEDVSQVPSMRNIRKDKPSINIAEPGDKCFSGGLIGPDGTNRHLGKWCKRGHNKGLPFAPGDDLIAVGADGRGGRTKVLRSPKQSTLDDKENSTATKRSKIGARISSHSQERVQIEHFFGRVSQ